MPTHVIKREWKEVFASKSLLVTNLLAPLIILGLAILTTSSAQNAQLEFILNTVKLMNPMLNVLDSQGPIVIGRFYFLVFLIVPAMLPLTLATSSIITEKMTGSLETVLVTPISTKQFLLGKILAFSIPSVVVTWVIQAIFLVFIFTSYADAALFFPVTFIASMVVLAPLLSLIAVTLSVIVSSRVSNISAAQQFGIIIVLPILGMAISQVIFLSMMSNPLVYMAIVLVCSVIAIVTFQVSVKLFSRENIISNWKA
ncbi:ABC transporter permease [Brevibacillus dissolubilis]|uniref:ABC transporter permease n=1 Tax=Brevibacillus dissolubilis TaxID=1844116 RepID=UPI0011160222|nr:ABC transporter permease [Brevibacillus dissolubilis]